MTAAPSAGARPPTAPGRRGTPAQPRWCRGSAGSAPSDQDDAADGDQRRRRSSGPAARRVDHRCTAAAPASTSDGHPAGDARPCGSTVACWYLVRPVTTAGEERRVRPHCAQPRGDRGPAVPAGSSSSGYRHGGAPRTRCSHPHGGDRGWWHDRAMAEPTAPPLAAAQDEVAELLSDLIRIDTTNTGDTATSAGERAAAEWVACKLADVGIESPDLRVRAGPGQPGRPHRGHRPQPRRRCSCTATSTSCPPTRPSGACTRSPARSATATSGAAARST